MGKKKATQRRAKKVVKKAATGRGSVGARLKAFCRTLPGVTEDVKWGDDLVFSVGGKMFAAFDLETEEEFAFKSEEDEFMGLIQVEGIVPAPYLAKHHWVKVQKKGAMPERECKRLLTKAHALVLEGLSSKKRREILDL